jgi:peptidyl-prolyl cis-trans isomerase D
MLQLFHKYFGSFFLLLAAGVVVFSMLFFGTDSSLQGSQGYAMKINGEEIAASDYYNYQRGYEDNLRNTFGAAYSQIFTPELIRQNVNDAIINGALLRQLANRLGLAVGDQEISTQILDKTFNGDRNLYQNVLRAQGISATTYERMVDNDLMSQKIASMLELASFASKAEVTAEYIKAQTKYNLEFTAIDPAKLVDKTKEPEQSEIEDYYNNNAASLEAPASAKYDYVVFDPAKSTSSVEVAEEDIQIYYADHLADYTKPAQTKVSQIKISFDGNMDLIKQSEQRVLADDIYKKAKDGVAFATLVNSHSQDAESKKNQGSIGWIKQGQLETAIDKAIFDAQAPGVLAPVVGNEGLYILNIEEIQPESTTELDKVRDIIKSKLQERDAPAFTLAKADQMLKLWKSGEQALSELIKDQALELKAGDKLLNSQQDPDPSLAGLTKKVIEQSTEKKQLLELGNLIILAELKEYKEPGIPTLAEIKDKIVAELKQKSAVALAKSKADEMMQQLKAESEADTKTAKPSLKMLAEKNGLKIEEIKEAKSSDSSQDFLTNPANREAIFALKTAGIVPETLSHQNVLYLVNITEINLPDMKSAKEDELVAYTESAKRKNLEILSKALINNLKLNANIKIDPAYGQAS